MHILQLWDFLVRELPCPPSPSASAQSVISDKTTAAEKERLITNYDDCLALYESQFRAYMTWLDDDARAGSVLTANLEYRFAGDMWILSGLVRCGLFFVRSMSLLDNLPILLLLCHLSHLRLFLLLLVVRVVVFTVITMVVMDM
jgi:hypothetical protein